jgi:hypothetical protein
MTANSIIAASVYLAALAAAVSAQPVDVCDPAKFQGAYGFQLSGQTTISGTAKPVASIGRLEFDGQGGVTGEASVNFAGYYLGNPVTGKYQVQADCTLTWSLQDDSGNWQHFRGKLTPDLLAARFQQTGEGAAHNGTMQKVGPNCSTSALSPSYTFSISGSAIPMNPGDVPPHRITATGTAKTDSSGTITLDVGGNAGSGTVDIDSNCIATVTLNLPSGEALALRGVLVDGGKRILAMETDPGTAVTATFTAK